MAVVKASLYTAGFKNTCLRFLYCFREWTKNLFGIFMLKKWSNKVNHTSIKSGNECLTTWLIAIHFTFWSRRDTRIRWRIWRWTGVDHALPFSKIYSRRFELTGSFDCGTPRAPAVHPSPFATFIRRLRYHSHGTLKSPPKHSVPLSPVDAR